MKICCALSAFILFLNQIYAQGVLVSTENPEMLENAEHEIKHDAITFKNATLNQKNNHQDFQVDGRFVHKATNDSILSDEQDPKSFKV